MNLSPNTLKKFVGSSTRAVFKPRENVLSRLNLSELKKSEDLLNDAFAYIPKDFPTNPKHEFKIKSLDEWREYLPKVKDKNGNPKFENPENAAYALHYYVNTPDKMRLAEKMFKSEHPLLQSLDVDNFSDLQYVAPFNINGKCYCMDKFESKNIGSSSTDKGLLKGILINVHSDKRALLYLQAIDNLKKINPLEEGLLHNLARSTKTFSMMKGRVNFLKNFNEIKSAENLDQLTLVESVTTPTEAKWKSTLIKKLFKHGIAGMSAVEQIFLSSKSIRQAASKVAFIREVKPHLSDSETGVLLENVNSLDEAKLYASFVRKFLTNNIEIAPERLSSLVKEVNSPLQHKLFDYLMSTKKCGASGFFAMMQKSQEPKEAEFLLKKSKEVFEASPSIRTDSFVDSVLFMHKMNFHKKECFDSMSKILDIRRELLEFDEKLESEGVSKKTMKQVGLDIDKIMRFVDHKMGKSIAVSDVDISHKREFLKNIISHADEKEQIIKNAKIEGYGQSGLPLKYWRFEFIEDLNSALKNVDERQKKRLFEKLEITVKKDENGKILSYEGIPTLGKLDDNNPLHLKVKNIVNNFMFNNEFDMADIELNASLNSVIKAFPEWVNVVGKKQHSDTQKYSVDVHMLKVLKEAMNNPEYQNLSDADKTVLKFSILFHDISKQEDVVDEGHHLLSALYVRDLLKKIDLSQDLKDRIYEMVKNHHWLKDFNTDKASAQNIALRFRNPQDYKIAKIFAESDLKGVSEGFYKEYGSALSVEKQKPIQEALEQFYETGNIMLTSKIINQAKLPQVSYEGRNLRLLNLTDIPDGVDMGQYGFVPSVKAGDLRFCVHMVPRPAAGFLKTVDSLTDISKGGVFSSSFISINKKETYSGEKYGVVFDTLNSNIASAFSDNQGSSMKKDFNKFGDLAFSKGHFKFYRDFIKNRIIWALEDVYGAISDSQYAELYSQIVSKKHLSQINDVKIGENLIKAQDLRGAVSKAQDGLLNAYMHNEVVVYNPKISAVICKENSLENVPKSMLDFACEKDLPVILIGAE